MQFDKHIHYHTKVNLVVEIQRNEGELNRIYAERTGQTMVRIAAAMERDKWLTPDEAKDYGLIDQVLGKRGWLFRRRPNRKPGPPLRTGPPGGEPGAGGRFSCEVAEWLSRLALEQEGEAQGWSLLGASC